MFEAIGLAALSGLGCRKTCLPEGHLRLPWSLTSDNGRAPGRMFGTLLPIPDAEYLAFYPIDIKVSCVCIKTSDVSNFCLIAHTLALMPGRIFCVGDSE
jgi:hypothetical protein